MRRHRWRRLRRGSSCMHLWVMLWNWLRFSGHVRMVRLWWLNRLRWFPSILRWSLWYTGNVLLEVRIEVHFGESVTTSTAVTIVVASGRIGLSFDCFYRKIKRRFSFGGACSWCYRRRRWSNRRCVDRCYHFDRDVLIDRCLNDRILPFVTNGWMMPIMTVG